MTDRDQRIDGKARGFVDAAYELADEMLGKLQDEAPHLAEQAARALMHGQRMQLVLDFHPVNPSIAWQLVDDYEKPSPIMTIPGHAPSRH